MAQWTWVAAACRGTSHERSGTRLQDSKYCFVHKGKRGQDTFVSVISDGAGSASHGGEGSVLVCRIIGSKIREHFRLSESIPEEARIESWVNMARDMINIAATKRSKTSRDFAATLVMAISNANTTVVAQIGDGCVVLKDIATNQWIAPTWPDHGEYASTTCFVTDDPIICPTFKYIDAPISALASFSDGLERLALDLVLRKPYAKFFEGVCRPLFVTSVIGREQGLSDQLKYYLNSTQINERTDDDKTLVLAVTK